MKKLLPLTILTACAFVLCACHIITIPTPNGPATFKSFGQKVQFSKAGMGTNGVITVEGYNLDQVTLPLATLQALSAAAAKGAMVP